MVNYFNIKMLKGLQKTIYNNCNKATRVLKELQQNESLRIQLYKTKISLRDQHQQFISATINQQMLAESIMTQLTMVLRRFKGNENEQVYSIATTVQKCIEDMGCLMEHYDSIRSDCGACRPTDSEETKYYEQIISSCSSKLNEAQVIIEAQRAESQHKDNEIQKLKQEIQQVKQQFNQAFSHCQRSLKENAITKEEMRKIAVQKQQIQQNCKKGQSEVEELRKYNDHLSQQLRQSREVSGKHWEYIKMKEREIETENSRLIEMNRAFMIEEAKMGKLIVQKQQEISKLQEKNSEMEGKIREYQCTFQAIIDKENKIRLLQTERRNGRRLPLQQAVINKQNASMTQKREVGKVTKKFNLLSFQEKLSTNDSFHPH